MSDRMWPNRWKSKYFVFYWKLGVYGQNNVQHDNVDIHNNWKRHSNILSCYLNNHELTFYSSKNVWISVAKKNFTFYQIWPKVRRCGIDKPEGICRKTPIWWQLEAPARQWSKHIAKVVLKGFKEKDISDLEWPIWSPGLNPIDNLWRDLKTWVMARKPINLTQLESFAKDEWTKIPQETFSKLVSTYMNRLETVIKNIGYAIDF